MLEYRFDTQLLIEGSKATEDQINDYITEHFQGDCLIVVRGQRCAVKLHYHQFAVEGVNTAYVQEIF